jgi:ribosomal protein S19
LPEFLGYRFEVYNGRNFIPMEVKAPMIGEKFGSYSITRTVGVHPEKEDSRAAPVAKKPAAPTDTKK